MNFPHLSFLDAMSQMQPRSYLSAPTRGPRDPTPRVLRPSSPWSILIATALGAALLLATATPAAAQFDQYTEPGRFDEERESTQNKLEDAIKRAPWRLGRTYLEPWLALQDVSYSDNVLGTSDDQAKVDDVTATVGVGLRLLRPVGSATILTVEALPRYVWWQDLSERRRVNGRFGTGVFGNLGKTGFEVTAYRSDDATFVSREFETRVNIREDAVATDLEVDIGRGLALLAGAAHRSFDYLDQDIQGLGSLALLDREETLVRAGVRLELSNSSSAALGVEHSSVAFASPDADRLRSNSGLSPTLQLEFAGRLAALGARLAWRDLEARTGAATPAFQGVTGRAQLALRRSERLETQLYGTRNLVYSLQSDFAHYTESILGAAVAIRVGSRARMRLFGETGGSNYTAFESDTPARSDDLNGYGATIDIRLGRATLSLGGARIRYDSNLPGFDRAVTTLMSGLGIGGRRGFATSKD